jgi:hypothetical protein
MPVRKEAMLNSGGFHAPQHKVVRPCGKLCESNSYNVPATCSPDEGKHIRPSRQVQVEIYVGLRSEIQSDYNLLDPEFDAVESWADYVNSEYRLQIYEAA